MVLFLLHDGSSMVERWITISGWSGEWRREPN